MPQAQVYLPQWPNPLEAMQRAYTTLSAFKQLQAQDLALRAQQQQLQDEENLKQLYNEFGGDWDKILEAARQRGNVSMAGMEYITKMRENEKKFLSEMNSDQLRQALNQVQLVGTLVKNVTDEKSFQAALDAARKLGIPENTINQLADRGYDPTLIEFIKNVTTNKAEEIKQQIEQLDLEQRRATQAYKIGQAKSEAESAELQNQILKNTLKNQENNLPIDTGNKLLNSKIYLRLKSKGLPATEENILKVWDEIEKEEFNKELRLKKTSSGGEAGADEKTQYVQWQVGVRQGNSELAKSIDEYNRLKAKVYSDPLLQAQLTDKNGNPTDLGLYLQSPPKYPAGSELYSLQQLDPKAIGKRRWGYGAIPSNQVIEEYAAQIMAQMPGISSEELAEEVKRTLLADGWNVWHKTIKFSAKAARSQNNVTAKKPAPPAQPENTNPFSQKVPLSNLVR